MAPSGATTPAKGSAEMRSRREAMPARLACWSAAIVVARAALPAVQGAGVPPGRQHAAGAALLTGVTLSAVAQALEGGDLGHFGGHFSISWWSWRRIAVRDEPEPSKNPYARQ
jgi:hypothetical protein